MPKCFACNEEGTEVVGDVNQMFYYHGCLKHAPGAHAMLMYQQQKKMEEQRRADDFHHRLQPIQRVLENRISEAQSKAERNSERAFVLMLVQIATLAAVIISLVWRYFE